jgi:hypothetical protein
MKTIEKIALNDVTAKYVCNSWLMEIVYMCLEKDLAVYSSSYFKKELTYFYIVNDNGGICYIQYDRLSGITLSTRHIPCREHGGGFGFDGVVFQNNEEILNLILKICAGKKPEWSYKYKTKSYVDFQDYINRRKNIWAEYIQIV